MRSDICIAVYALIVAVGCLSVTASESLAQGTGGLQYATADNGVIAVQVERSTGQFRIIASDGTPLLFSGEKGVTGYTNVHYGSNTYTTNLLHRPSAPAGSRPMRQPAIDALPDRVRIQAALVDRGDTLFVRQDLIPSIDGDYAYINIVTTLENRSDRTLRAGSLLMQDIMIGKHDQVNFVVDSAVVSIERGWSGAQVPGIFEADVANSPYRIRGRLESATADRPDFFVAGNWQFNGYLGTAVWNYTPSGLEITDHAVLLRWDDADLPARSSRTMRTDYGFIAIKNVSITCDLPELVSSDDSSSYTPWPIPATAVITNTGTLPLSNLDVQITLPAELRLMPGETLIQRIAGPLLPGRSATLTWFLDADTVDQPTLAVVNYSIISPQDLARQCAAQTTIPPLVLPRIALDCGDTIRLGRNLEGAGYLPDPFAIIMYLENTGNVPVSGLVAELQLPPGLVLAAGSLTQAVLPDPLAPGSGTVIDWQVRAINQNVRTVASYSIRVFNSALEEVCENAVIIPPLISDPCVEPGINTAGTSFWVAFLKDSVGIATEALRIYLSAPEEARVQVHHPNGSDIDSLVIPAGGLRMVEVDSEINNYPTETAVRKGVRLLSDRPIHVFAGNFRDRHTDAYTVLPDHALGTRYVTAGYNWAEASEHFCILASEDQTDVRITPASFTSSGRPTGQEFQVSLNAGELYYVRSYVAGSGGSLTGTRIEANRPVAVVSGAESGWVPEQGGTTLAFLNPLAEQMIPNRFLGTEYVLTPFRSRYGGDTYRIIATEDSTSISIGGNPSLLLHPAGMWVEDLVTRPLRVTSDKPVMAAQYANSANWDTPTNEYGDGSMLLQVPTDRYMSCHYFPAGTLIADAAIIPNVVAQVDDLSWLEVARSPRLAVPVFTVEGWVQLFFGGVVVSRTSGSDALWKLEYENARARLAFHTERPGYGSYETSADNSIINGAWTHIALVVDGPAGKATAYINGSEAMVATFSPTDFTGDAGLAWGGVHGDSNASLFIGEFDECRFWEGKRTAQQINTAMSVRLHRLDRSGLLGYWSFCDGFRDETLYRHQLIPRVNAVLQESYSLPAALNCEEQRDSNFVNLVIPDGAEAAVTVNFEPLGAGEYDAFPGSGFSTARLLLPTGINRIETSDTRGVGASSYGFAYHDAYTTYTGFRVQGSVQSVRPPAQPSGMELHPPWPQPAHGDVTISYSLTHPSRIRLTMYDLSGRRVRLLDSGFREAGQHEIRVDGYNLSGGNYLVQLQANGQRTWRRVVLFR